MSSPLTSGTVLEGRYTLGECLGQGAFGSVYRADDRYREADVAVKVLRDPTPEVVESLERETLVLRLLRLPGVVHLLDERLASERPFVVMPLIEGAPFPGRRDVPVAWEEIESQALSLAESLSRVHALGIVHRDLKPSNVLVNEHGIPFLLDFGISHGADWSYIESYSLGTPSYLAPEQAEGRIGDARADLYAFGTMLYEALSGCLPFDAPDVGGLLSQKVSGFAIPLDERVDGVPGHVLDLVDALLERHPEDRPSSAQHVVATLSGSARDLHLPRLKAVLGDVREVDGASLAEVFHGLEWGLRERSRAAEVVISRSGSRLRNVARQVGDWVRSGRAFWDGDRLRFAPDQLEALESGWDRSATVHGTDLRTTLERTVPADMRERFLASGSLAAPKDNPLLRLAEEAHGASDFAHARDCAFAAARFSSERGEDDVLVEALTLGARAVFQRQPTVAEIDEALYRFDSLAHSVAAGHPARRLLLAARETLAANRETALGLLEGLAGELPPALEVHRLGFELRNRLRLVQDEREVLSAFERARSSARSAGLGEVRPLMWMANLHAHHERYDAAFACFEEALGAAATEEEVRLATLGAAVTLCSAVGLSETDTWLQRTDPDVWKETFASAPPLKLILAHASVRIRKGDAPDLPQCLGEAAELASRAERLHFLLPLAGEYWRLGRLPEARVLADSSFRSAESWRFDDGLALAGLARFALGCVEVSQEKLEAFVSTLRQSGRARLRASGLALAAMLLPERFATEEVREEVDAALAGFASSAVHERLELLTAAECASCVRGEAPDWMLPVVNQNGGGES